MLGYQSVDNIGFVFHIIGANFTHSHINNSAQRCGQRSFIPIQREVVKKKGCSHPFLPFIRDYLILRSTSAWVSIWRERFFCGHLRGVTLGGHLRSPKKVQKWGSFVVVKGRICGRRESTSTSCLGHENEGIFRGITERER